jgi:tRNA(Ile)-lysidine synthase
MPGDRAVVAVSGGVDSVALAHMLAEWRTRGGYTLTIATVDHGLRADSADDVELVRQLARRLGLDFRAGQLDLQHATAGSGLEAAARQYRYEWLATIALQVGADKIITAHHADDQAETILLHLLRGAGIDGTRGMRYSLPAPFAPDLSVIRPLLSVRKADLYTYCAENDLSFREDTTNQDVTIPRNRLRHRVLPELEAINPAAVTLLNRYAQSASLDADFIHTAFETIIRPQMQFHAEYVQIPLADLLQWHPALQRRAMLTAMTDPTATHVEALLAMARADGAGRTLDLPAGQRALLDYEALVIGDVAAYVDDRHAAVPTLSPGQRIRLVVGQDADTGQGWSLRLGDQPQAHGVCWHMPADTSKVELRTRRPGDRFGRHKLKDWMIRHHIPAYLRDAVPLIAVDDEIRVVFYGPPAVYEPESSVESGVLRCAFINFHNSEGV